MFHGYQYLNQCVDPKLSFISCRLCSPASCSCRYTSWWTSRWVYCIYLFIVISLLLSILHLYLLWFQILTKAWSLFSGNWMGSLTGNILAFFWDSKIPRSLKYRPTSQIPSIVRWPCCTCGWVWEMMWWAKEGLPKLPWSRHCTLWRKIPLHTEYKPRDYFPLTLLSHQVSIIPHVCCSIWNVLQCSFSRVWLAHNFKLCSLLHFLKFWPWSLFPLAVLLPQLLNKNSFS